VKGKHQRIRSGLSWSPRGRGRSQELERLERVACREKEAEDKMYQHFCNMTRPHRHVVETRDNQYSPTHYILGDQKNACLNARKYNCQFSGLSCLRLSQGRPARPPAVHRQQTKMPAPSATPKLAQKF